MPILVLIALLSAADWPRFRGPGGNGVLDVRNLPSQFSTPDWKVDLPAGGSSPVISSERVYVTAYEASRRFVICIDLKSGERLWERYIEAPRTERKTKPNDPATPTPVTDGRNVYAFFSDFGLISYTRDGPERWRTALGPFDPPHGMSSSPILAGGSVILLADGANESYIAAFDSATGKIRWKTPRSSFAGSYTTPAICGTDLIVTGPVELIAYSPKTGERRWSAPNVGAMPVSVPVCCDDRIFSNNAGLPPYQDLAIKFKGDKNEDGKLDPDEFPDPAFKGAVLAIDRIYGNGDGAIDAKEWDGALKLMQTINALVALRVNDGRPAEMWRATKALPDVPSPLLYNGVLFTLKEGGILTSYDPESGTILKQGRLVGALDRYFASLVAGDGKLYAVSEPGKVAVIKAAPEWDLMRVDDLKEECYATPAIAEGALLIRTRSALSRYGNPPSRATGAR